MRDNKNTNHFIDSHDENPVIVVVERFTKSGDESENYRGINYLKALESANRILKLNLRDGFKDSIVEIRQYYDESELDYDLLELYDI